jgi:hypothetical protein
VCLAPDIASMVAWCLTKPLRGDEGLELFIRVTCEVELNAVMWWHGG